MELSDPDHRYALSNLQLQSLVSDLANCIIENDCSKDIKDGLLRQGTLLVNDTAYPRQDPNYPMVAFDKRRQDMLDSLDQARKVLKDGGG